MSKIIGKLNPKSSQSLVVYSVLGKSPTLQAAMGEGGGQVPLIVERKKTMNEVVRAIRLGNVYGEQFGGSFGGNIWDTGGYRHV